MSDKPPDMNTTVAAAVTALVEAEALRLVQEIRLDGQAWRVRLTPRSIEPNLRAHRDGRP